MRITRDGYPLIGFVLFMTVGSFFVSPILPLFLGVLTAFVIWFFRDPERIVPVEDDVWVSPADGRVVEIDEVEHPFTGRALKIGIFMNVFDVHINRMPFAGRVSYLEYVPGRKWMAFAPKASEVNERMYVGLETDCGRLLVVQIAGLLARRIVCRLRKGAVLEKGERFGMIKLGSKVDVYLPVDLKPTVELGQKVKAGSTCIGVRRYEDKA